jgi:hypothetical protein
MDMEFKKLEGETTEVIVNTTAAREHVGDIERCIRSIRDRCRSIVSELPYKNSYPTYSSFTYLNLSSSG